MKKLAIALISLLFPVQAYAGSDLLYLEAQGIAGYSRSEHKAVYHSADRHDAMQKNAVGFDWVHKFSGDQGDRGMTAVQFRLAYNDEEKDFTPQFYNAYLKYKTGGGDFWIGHNRVAFGLSSYWDTHADLIGDLTMQGVGFDRDWGTGYGYDFENGSFAASVTAGSGMDFRRYGNAIAAMRIATGVLNFDNYTTGISVMAGKMLDTMGYKILEKDPQDIRLIGWDGAYNADNYEHKIELDAGERNHRSYYAALYRFSIVLDSEERWKGHIQPTYIYQEGRENQSLATSIEYRLTSDIVLRFMHRYQHRNDDNSFIGQLYWYAPV
ncbi:MAG: hypothetical protein IJ752_09615 [Alphaproteobacteria bacterium]|nr:hypothetical protein [Alphaproteobacteria bacterium]